MQHLIKGKISIDHCLDQLLSSQYIIFDRTCPLHAQASLLSAATFNVKTVMVSLVLNRRNPIMAELKPKN
jgi:hypothetical protein